MPAILVQSLTQSSLIQTYIGTEGSKLHNGLNLTTDALERWTEIRNARFLLPFWVVHVVLVTWSVSLQEMCSLQCSLHKVNKEELTRVVRDSRVPQHGGSREFLIVQ